MNQKIMIIIQGAPERILALCDNYWIDGELRQVSNKIGVQITDSILELKRKGKRVLVLAELLLDLTFYDVSIAVVIAHTSSQQKLLIVRVVPKLGCIVAAIGDGVNDSHNKNLILDFVPAALAKEAADMILTHDHFASIVNGVEEGRIIFDTLDKSIAPLFNTISEIFMIDNCFALSLHNTSLILTHVTVIIMMYGFMQKQIFFKKML